MLTLADAPLNSWQRCSSHGTLLSSANRYFVFRGGPQTASSLLLLLFFLFRINIKIRASLRHAAATRYPRESTFSRRDGRGEGEEEVARRSQGWKPSTYDNFITVITRQKTDDEMQNGVGCISGMEFRRGNFSGGEEVSISLSFVHSYSTRARRREKGEKGRGEKGASKHRFFGSSLIELKFFERSSTAFMPTSIPE